MLSGSAAEDKIEILSDDSCVLSDGDEDSSSVSSWDSPRINGSLRSHTNGGIASNKDRRIANVKSAKGGDTNKAHG